MNPIVAAGDVVQLRIDLAKASSLTVSEIPKAWRFEDGLRALKAGTNYLSVKVPRGADQQVSQIHLKDAAGTDYKFRVEVVRRVRG